MSNNEEKRMAGDFEIIHAMRIGDREIVLGENPQGVGDERYSSAWYLLHRLRKAMGQRDRDYVLPAS